VRIYKNPILKETTLTLDLITKYVDIALRE
jgi:hypothetical protein